MSRQALMWDAVRAIARRDAVLFFSYNNRLLTQVLIVVGNLTLFYYVSRLVESGRFPSPDAYFAFVVVGLVILHVITATLANLPQAVRQELVAGTFERLAVSPLGPAAGIVGMTLFPTISSLVIGIVTLILAATVFGLDLAWSTLPLAAPVAVIAAAAFIPFSVLTATLMITYKQVGSFGSFLVIGLSLVGGVYFPVTLLPGWLRWISEIQPFTPSLNLLRHLIVGTPLDESGWVELAKLIGFGAVFLPISIYVLNRGIDRCRRHGSLIEY